ncbi:RNA-binding S4 domain-containing protein [Oscillospiraceae bacterium HV4-5-C5C]|nr:RNA-binding S4 domain-containing protein [Oscillospiraceae bacterium HV4-5-C5C]
MRLDKFLKVSRIIKRRSVASEVCGNGRVKLNGKVARASAEVKAGDILEISFGSGVSRVRITKVQETVRKDDAAELYEVMDGENLRQAAGPKAAQTAAAQADRTDK